MKKQKKVVKGWIVIHSETKKVEQDAYFNGGDCCCAGEPQALAIYDRKSTALDAVRFNEVYEIAPCEIIIKLPKRKV